MGSSTPLPSSRRCPIGAVALLCFGLVGAADPRAEQARARFQAAQKAYDVGQFQEALDGFSKAYELKPLPGFLFNIAQCHRQMGNLEQALFYLKRYLDLAPRGPAAADARQLVRQTEEALAAAERRRAEEAEASRHRELKLLEAAREAAAHAEAEAAEKRLLELDAASRLEVGRQPAEPLYRHWWFWAGVGVIVAGAASTAWWLNSPSPNPVTLGTVSWK